MDHVLHLGVEGRQALRVAHRHASLSGAGELHQRPDPDLRGHLVFLAHEGDLRGRRL
jgi:hypothetical protein